MEAGTSVRLVERNGVAHVLAALDQEFVLSGGPIEERKEPFHESAAEQAEGDYRV